MIDYQAAPTPPAKKTGGNPLMLIISGVLAVALIAVGVLYVMEMGKLNKANDNIASLETNVTSLQSQLATEKASVASLQTQLAAEKANVADLQTQLTAAKGQITSLTADLATATAKVTSLTADLATANGKVTSLTADLATANGAVTNLQGSLLKAGADLAAAVALNTTQAATLKKVQDPRHFDTLAELTAWLAKDDTNTNPAYAAYSPAAKAYILQVKALRDGYILSTALDYDATSIYSWNVAVAGGMVVMVNAANDAILTGPTFASPPPSHPLPLP